MIVSTSMIEAMVEGLKRVKRLPEREWLDPLIRRLEQLAPGEKLTLERRTCPRQQDKAA